MENEHHLTPLERSRMELGKAIDEAVGYSALTKHEGSMLREQLTVDGHDTTRSGKTRQALLKSLAGKIENRKVELRQRRFVNRQLGYSGLLGLAIGDPAHSVAALDRPSLLNEPAIVNKSAQNPNVDRSVILDKTLEFDVRWLTEPTKLKNDIS